MVFLKRFGQLTAAGIIKPSSQPKLHGLVSIHNFPPLVETINRSHKRLMNIREHNRTTTAMKTRIEKVINVM
jgi:hypothetical protein